MPGRVSGRHKEVDAAFNEGLVVVAEHRACQLLFEPIGKAPTVKPVLKCTIALVIKQACHDGSPWLDHLRNSGRKFARMFEFSLIPGRAGTFIFDRATHRWTVPLLGRNSGVTCSSESTMGTIYEKACPWVGDIGDILDVCTGDGVGAGARQRCRLGRRFGRGGIRPGGRGCRRGHRIYRWTIHCSFLGTEKVRFEARRPGEIPRRHSSKPYQRKSAADGGKPGAIGNHGGCTT